MRVCALCLFACGLVFPAASWSASGKPMRSLSYDPNAPAVDLLGENAQGKLGVRVIPQNEFRSRILIENKTDAPLTVKLPKAVAAVHVVPKKDPPVSRVRSQDDPEDASDAPGNAQAVVGTFGPMNAPANSFPHQSEDGCAFTIPAGRSVQIALHSACAEHGKRTPISRMTYRLKPLAEQTDDKTLQKIVKFYNPKTTDPLAFQAVVWHLANKLSWEALAKKTVKKGGQTVPYFTRRQLIAAQKLIADAGESSDASAVP